MVNGAHVHPGANFVEDEHGRKTDLSKLSRDRREAISQTLMTKALDDDTNASLALSSGPAGGSGIAAVKSKKVWRHLRTGDVMLVNRQPTLHKASIMAHNARVLKKDDVVRMHYANCNSYVDDRECCLRVVLPSSLLVRQSAFQQLGVLLTTVRFFFFFFFPRQVQCRF